MQMLAERNTILDARVSRTKRSSDCAVDVGGGRSDKI